MTYYVNSDKAVYKQTKTENQPLGGWGKPIATLKDEHGGVSHVVVDDGCYVLLNGNNKAKPNEFKPSSWIYPEAFEVIKKLPSL